MEHTHTNRKKFKKKEEEEEIKFAHDHDDDDDNDGMILKFKMTLKKNDINHNNRNLLNEMIGCHRMCVLLYYIFIICATCFISFFLLFESKYFFYKEK